MPRNKVLRFALGALRVAPLSAPLAAVAHGISDADRQRMSE